MMEVFADTSYFIALLNPSDEAYERARSVTLGMRARLVTNDWVLTELGNLLSRSRTRSRFVETLRSPQSDPDVLIVKSGSHWFNAGVELYAARQDKDWSLTDCISFVTMKERSITDALTGDRHFEQTGFRALLV